MWWACPVFVLSIGGESCVCAFYVNPVWLNVVAKDGCLVLVDEVVTDYACPCLLCGFVVVWSGVLFYVPRSF